MRPPQRPRAGRPPSSQPTDQVRRQSVERRRRITASRPAGPATEAAPTKAVRRVDAGPRRVPETERAPRERVVSTGMLDRLAERRAMDRHRRRRNWLVAGAVVVVVAVVGWLFAFSPVFALERREVTISGAGTAIDERQVRGVVDTFDGVPLVRLDTVRLSEDLLKLTGVKSATVTRDWPHGLVVRLVPRQPVAAVPDGRGFALVDDEGVRVGSAATAPAGLAQVSVPLDGSAQAKAALEASVALLGALPDDLRAEVTGVSAKTQDSVTMTLRGGTTVLWGSSDEAALKVRVLVALRKVPENAAVKVFDVSSPTMPITR